MTIGATMHPYQQDEIIPEGKRLRMKDWLKIRIGNPRYPGLVWLDREQQIFKIPWKHAALQGWNQNSDGALFRDWAEHTGSCVRNAQPKTLKATFRCALHSLPDVHEDKKLAKKRGDDACRVYRFVVTSSSAPKKRHIRIRNHHKDRKKMRGPSSPQTHEASPPYGININQQNPRSSVEWSLSSQSSSRSQSCNDSFMPRPANPANSGVYFQDHQQPWLMQSETDNYSSLSLPAASPSSTTTSAVGFHEGFKPMQHSVSDPNIVPYYRAENKNLYEQAMHPAQSHSPLDAFTSKGQFEESVLYRSPPQGPVSPTSRSISDPGTPPCYYTDTQNTLDCPMSSFYAQPSSPTTLSQSCNAKSRKAIFQGQQQGATSPLNPEYVSNASPASSVVSTCQSNQFSQEYFSLGHGQTADNTECMTMPILQSSNAAQNYQVLDNISKSLGQRGTSPYYGDTISASVMTAPSNVQVSSSASVGTFSYPSGMMEPNTTALLNKATEYVLYDNGSPMPWDINKQPSSLIEGSDSDSKHSEEICDLLLLPHHMEGALEEEQSDRSSKWMEGNKLPAIETLSSF